MARDVVVTVPKEINSELLNEGEWWVIAERAWVVSDRWTSVSDEWSLNEREWWVPQKGTFYVTVCTNILARTFKGESVCTKCTGTVSSGTLNQADTQWVSTGEERQDFTIVLPTRSKNVWHWVCVSILWIPSVCREGPLTQCKCLSCCECIHTNLVVGLTGHSLVSYLCAERDRLRCDKYGEGRTPSATGLAACHSQCSPHAIGRWSHSLLPGTSPGTPLSGPHDCSQCPSSLSHGWPDTAASHAWLQCSPPASPHSWIPR